MLDIQSLLHIEGLYSTSFPTGEVIVWRILNMKEYNIFCKIRESGEMPELLFYEKVFEYCYQGKYEYFNGNILFGSIISIGRLIMFLSGDASINEKEEIEEARARYRGESVIEFMKRIILLAFTNYTPDDFKNWTREKVLDTFVLAEAILVDRTSGTDRQYKPLDIKSIMTQAEYARKQKKSNAIDFKRENMALEEYDTPDVHPAEMNMDELDKLRKKTVKLSQKELKQLSENAGRGQIKRRGR